MKAHFKKNGADFPSELAESLENIVLHSIHSGFSKSRSWHLLLILIAVKADKTFMTDHIARMDNYACQGVEIMECLYTSLLMKCTEMHVVVVDVMHFPKVVGASTMPLVARKTSLSVYCRVHAALAPSCFSWKTEKRI